MVTATIWENQRATIRLLEDIPAVIQEHLANPEIIEILANPDGSLWVDDLQAGMHPIGKISPSEAESLINVIASMTSVSVTRENAILECDLPQFKARFSAVIPPVSEKPIFSIRLKAVRIFSLADYVSAGILSLFQEECILQWVTERKNILVVGGTSSGKTTLINAVIQAIADIHPNHRLVILEDTPELQCNAANCAYLQSNRAHTMQTLVKTTLRHRPDRIIVGEVRGPEVFDLLTAWSTGHPGGVASIHANSAEKTFLRLEQLNILATGTPMPYLIGDAVDAIVYIEKTATGRKVRSLLHVHDFDGKKYKTEIIKENP